MSKNAAFVQSICYMDVVFTAGYHPTYHFDHKCTQFEIRKGHHFPRLSWNMTLSTMLEAHTARTMWAEPVSWMENSNTLPWKHPKWDDQYDLSRYPVSYPVSLESRYIQYVIYYIYIYICLVVWMIFPYFWNVIIPIDELHHFSEGLKSNQMFTIW